MITITIRDALYFSYAGQKSVDYGIINVNLSSGMLEENFVPSRSIVEEKIKGRDQPYFMRTEVEPLQFSVSFAFEESWDSDKIREVARWLTQHDYYQELTFTTEEGVNPERIFYALVVDEATLIHNGLRQGYITLTFRCDSPYAYSPVMTTRTYEWKDRIYEWKPAFQTGINSKSVIVNSEGHLTLNTNRPKWSDYPKYTTWIELN